MEKNKIRVGAIVVVIEGITSGNTAGDITKILAKPGFLIDSTAKLVGQRFSKNMIEFVLCVDRHEFRAGWYRPKYLNKLAVYESIKDIRPATEEEKTLYRKSKDILL